jgi:UDP-N-acetylglucosamine transferase subunit ALG13
MRESLGTFVTTGNMSNVFLRLIDIVLENVNVLPKPILIQSINSHISHRHLEDVEFVKHLSEEEYHRCISISKIVISHAGVGSIMNCIKFGKPIIIMPRKQIYGEHINNHQVELCEYIRLMCDFIFVFNTSEELLSIIKSNNLYIPVMNDIPLFRNDLIVADIMEYLKL